MWDLLCDLKAETVLNLLTDWHGLQLLDDGFYDHLIEEGYIDEPAPEIEDDYEEFFNFCNKYPVCKGCPFKDVLTAECQELYATRRRDEMLTTEGMS